MNRVIHVLIVYTSGEHNIYKCEVPADYIDLVLLSEGGMINCTDTSSTSAALKVMGSIEEWEDSDILFKATELKGVIYSIETLVTIVFGS